MPTGGSVTQKSIKGRVDLEHEEMLPLAQWFNQQGFLFYNLVSESNRVCEDEGRRQSEWHYESPCSTSSPQGCVLSFAFYP